MAKYFNTSVTCDPKRHYFKVNYYADNLPLDLGRTFSFLRPDDNSNAQIHNLIFQQVLLNARYLSHRGLSEGYLVTFSFLKNKELQEHPEWIVHNGKRIYEAVI